MGAIHVQSGACFASLTVHVCSATSRAQTPAGTHYLAVVSEGQNPEGSRSDGYALASLGEVPMTHSVTLSGTDLVTITALEAGDVAAYRFTARSDTLSMELRLESRTGNPRMATWPGSSIVSPSWPYDSQCSYHFGSDGGSIIHPSDMCGEIHRVIGVSSPCDAILRRASNYRWRVAAGSPCRMACSTWLLRRRALEQDPRPEGQTGGREGTVRALWHLGQWEHGVRATPVTDPPQRPVIASCLDAPFPDYYARSVMIHAQCGPTQRSPAVSLS